MSVRKYSVRKYRVVHAGEIVGTRESKTRDYSHAVVVRYLYEHALEQASIITPRDLESDAWSFENSHKVLKGEARPHGGLPVYEKIVTYAVQVLKQNLVNALLSMQAGILTIASEIEHTPTLAHELAAMRVKISMIGYGSYGVVAGQ